MKFIKQAPVLLLSLIFMYAMLFYTFSEKTIFWYLYTFTLLVGIAISLVTEKFEDSLPTWQYLIFGIGYGTITYGIVKAGYLILPLISPNTSQQIASFLGKYGPSTVWHYLLLIFIIVVGEEMFWRGFVQQQLKQFVKSSYAVIITAALFSISVAISGFIPGVIAAFVAGLLWGALYEWKKSLPLIIVSHVVFVLLLFLVLPLT